MDGKLTSACTIRFEEKDKISAVYRVILHEGKKRQIRRMFEDIDAKVIKLKRVKYAGLTLKGLKSGEFRELSQKEIDRLKAKV